MAGQSTSSYGAAYAGIQIATSLLDNHYQRQLRNINQRLANTQAEAKNKVTAARNAAEGAESSLSGFIQSVNNQRLLNAGAKKQAAALSALQIGREIQAANSNDRRQAGQHAMGEAAAQAAFSGVIGGAPQRLQAALALREARVEQRARADSERDDFALGERAAGALGDAIAGQDNRTILPNRDESIATAGMVPNVDSPMLAALKSGADFGRLIRGTGDLTQFLTQQFKSSPMPGDPATAGALNPGAAGLTSPYFNFQFDSF